MWAYKTSRSSLHVDVKWAPEIRLSGERARPRAVPTAHLCLCTEREARSAVMTSSPVSVCLAEDLGWLGCRAEGWWYTAYSFHSLNFVLGVLLIKKKIVGITQSVGDFKKQIWGHHGNSATHGMRLDKAASERTTPFQERQLFLEGKSSPVEKRPASVMKL